MSCTTARFSFELYPPRSERAAAALPATIDRLAAEAAPSDGNKIPPSSSTVTRVKDFMAASLALCRR